MKTGRYFAVSACCFIRNNQCHFARTMKIKKPRECVTFKRARGIEPPNSAWEADVLPLNYARILEDPHNKYEGLGADKRT